MHCHSGAASFHTVLSVMRMRTTTLLATGISALALVVISVGWLSASEVILVRAIEDVPLFEPESLAGEFGRAPKQVGELKVGKELAVVECVDRKSDINVHAAYEGRVVAVGEWKAKVQLIRSPAYPWQRGAITSCQGFFENVSVHV